MAAHSFQGHAHPIVPQICHASAVDLLNPAGIKMSMFAAALQIVIRLFMHEERVAWWPDF